MHKFIRFVIYFLAVIIILTGGAFIYLYNVATVTPPAIAENYTGQTRKQIDKNCYTLGNNWLRRSSSGLWEMYVEGAPYERGLSNGILAKELIHEQEQAFSDQINKIVPSKFYRNFLRYFIGWFNRDLEDHIAEEFKLEIYGVSKSASPEFDYIGTSYQRMMNYHAAHDIGHALQNLALVGCSSFGTWNEKSMGNKLIIGRNFDFYVGDRFAENKIVQFVNPSKGYKFMMVSWGGMTGVVSGMNMEGLTITLNAAKSEIPPGSATPISLLAREILQYAKNIDEAVEIAQSRKTFVSESFLVGSSNDHKAVSIEITPDTLQVFDPGTNQIICTNHYQGDLLGKSESNKMQIQESASGYRMRRMQQLIDTLTENTVEKTVAILRNQSGMNNDFIGYGNEKAINQLIAHHAVVFDPGARIAWVSTGPWQLGEFKAYDLNKIFSMHGLHQNQELFVDSLTVPADTFLQTGAYTDFVEFRELKQQVMEGKTVNPEKLVQLNPEYYHAYVLAGDYLYHKNNFELAEKYYIKALTKEIATVTEEKYIHAQLIKCREKK